MPDWKILITDGLSEKGQAHLRLAAQVDDCTGISAADLLQVIPAYQALIVRSRTRVTAPLLAAAAQLKVVGRAGSGVDNIDLAAASARKVTVINAPLSTNLAVAEHTLALLFALARNIPQADTGMKSGLWLKKSWKGLNSKAGCSV